MTTQDLDGSPARRKTNLTPAKRALLERWQQGLVTGNAECIPLRPPDSPILLSFPQQRQLFLDLLEPGTAVNNLSICLELVGSLDLRALEESSRRIVIRHDVLRTRFHFGEGMPTPEVVSPFAMSIPVVDLREVTHDQRMTAARRLAEEEALRPFDLSEVPLIRLKLFQLELRRHLLLVVVHHTIGDGWSLGVFLRELAAFYQSLTSGTTEHLPELPIQYYDFAHWQHTGMHGVDLHSMLIFWKKRLEGELSILELPTDHRRLARQTFSGATLRFEIPPELTKALKEISQREDVSLFMTLLTGFYILLYRYSGQNDILVGTPVANRTRPELENLIGVFINTLVLRANLSDDPTFRGLLKRVRDLCLTAYAHQDLAFEKLVEELRPPRDLSHPPLFQVIFNLQNAPMPGLDIHGLSIRPMEIDRGVSQFDLTLMIAESEDHLRCTVEYNRDLFEAASIARMFHSFHLLFENALVLPDCPISRLQMMSDAELHVMSEWNQTQSDYPRDKCLHTLFESQADKTPDHIAVIHDDTRLTYSELNGWSNELARHLEKLGVSADIRVGIYMERSHETVAALLGVLKAGGTYVPIDTSFPADRVQFILNDANIRVLLTNVDLGHVGEQNVHVVNLNDHQLLGRSVFANPDNLVTPDTLAYIIYTSGSTGQPKGVMVQHSAIVNFLSSMQKQPGMKKDDVLLAVTSVSFDIAALEIFLPLTVGATVVVANKEMTTNPSMLAQAIDRHGVNVMQATPATWQIMLEAGWKGKPGLKALCGGDTLTRKLADQLLDHVGVLWNMYGPTETTVWSAMSEIVRGAEQITIGRPIDNTRLYVLDLSLHPVPIGVVGDLHIGGEGLARGYVNQTQLTNEKFITDPFSSGAGARLYRTGDCARYLADGSIELLGRIDDQVKIHGHRIELGEIAPVLMQHPGVHEAIVIARREVAGDRRLVAYFVPAKELSPSAGELQHFVRQKLPAYMVPGVFMRLDRFPLTPNGKINRHALPTPEEVRPDLETLYVEPRNEIERTIVGIWKEVLGIEKVGVHDNFFDLGGASIQSLQIVSQAGKAGLQFNPEIIFEYQTIAELAVWFETRAHNSSQQGDA